MIDLCDELIARALATFEAEGVVAVHLFGSLARGDGDAFSDVDLWITVPDERIEQLVARRHEIFSAIAEVVVHHEAPRNRPLGGAYTLAIHRIGEALIQADYYLAPESTSVILPEARHLAGRPDLPRGVWALDTNAEAIESRAERVDFLVCMSFIALKKAVRGDGAFLAFLDREFERFQRLYAPDADLSGGADDLDAIRQRLRALGPGADERQRSAIAATADYRGIAGGS